MLEAGESSTDFDRDAIIPLKKYPMENRHEGYGGWTTEHFATYYSETVRKGTARGSPFLYPDAKGNPLLDFSRYLQETNQGKAPDVVTIFLGL